MILVSSAKILKFNLSEQVEMSFILSKYKKRIKGTPLWYTAFHCLL